MEPPINNPHDKFVKAMLSDKEIAIAFLEAYLPEDLKITLDTQSLEYTNTSYITEELQESFSDIVVRIKLKDRNQNCFISLLLEHKSTISEHVSFQLLGYLANGYNTQIKNGAVIHPIIPLIYYQGKTEWHVKMVTDYFVDYPANYKAYIPTFQSLFIGLFELSEEALLTLQNGMLRSAMLVQRHRFDPLLLSTDFLRILSSLDPYIPRNFIQTLIVYTLQVTELKEENIAQIIDNIPIKLKNQIMSTYDIITKKGMDKGIEKGIQQKEIEVVLKGFENGLSIELLANITGLSIEKIHQILGFNEKEV